MIRVLIADDHAVVRQGLRTYLELQPDIAVVAVGGRRRGGGPGGGAPGPGHRPTRPRDAETRRRGGAGTAARACARRARHRAHELRGDERLFAALRAGAAGFLLKDTEPADLVRAIRTAQDGQSPLSPAVATRVVDELPHGARVRASDLLTPRELEVLRLIARGRSNKRIAMELGVAEKTVKTHVGHVLAKLGLDDRTQAALYAVREGLVEGSGQRPR